MTEMVEWRQITSPTILKIGYEKTTCSMYIHFNDAKPYYKMCGVTEELYKEFLETWEFEQQQH